MKLYITGAIIGVGIMVFGESVFHNQLMAQIGTGLTTASVVAIVLDAIWGKPF